MYTHIYIYIHREREMFIYIYIYTYIERDINPIIQLIAMYNTTAVLCGGQAPDSRSARMPVERFDWAAGIYNIT